MKKSAAGSLPGTDNQDFWEGARTFTNTKPEGFSVDECEHHFTSRGGNIIQCRFCGFGGPLKKRAEAVTLRNGKTYKVFAD